MNKFPQLDISAITYNSANWLELFFNSLFRQNYPVDKINLYIRDNGSTDNTLIICHEMQKKYQNKLASFAVTAGKNIGFGAGHNDNFSKSTSDFILVTNLDLEFAVDALTTVITTALKDGEEVASWEFRQKPYEHPKYYNPITLETTWSSSACVLFRKKAINAVKGYEERIFLYGEDVELSYRLRDRGYKLKYCPKAVCWHYSYEHAHQVKPLQFFGSTLANVYIRLRYGSLKHIIMGYVQYLALFTSIKRVPIPLIKQQITLGKNLLILIKNTSYFLITRKKSTAKFPLHFWDYEIIRDGAFYSYIKNSKNEQILPLVSIIIRTYAGRMGWLKEAIATVFNQTYPNIQLIIIEDGSTEANEYSSQLNTAGLLTSIYYESIPKSGRCVAGNKGLAAAEGEYCIFLDDDDGFFAEHIEVLVTEMQNSPKLGGVYGLSWQVLTEIHSTDPLRYDDIMHGLVHKQKFSRVTLWHHNYLPIQSVLFKRELYLQYGGFDESLENLEDWNLWTRYSLEHDFRLVEKLTSFYRVPADNIKAAERQIELDKYYKIAVQKQRQLILRNLSPPDVLAYAQEFTLPTEVVLKLHEGRLAKFRSKLKHAVLKYSFLRRHYHFFAKIGNILR